MSTNQHSILILCDAFGPPGYQPRIRNLALNLQKMGWKVHVIGELPYQMPTPMLDFSVTLFQHYKGTRLYYAFQWLADKLWNQKEKAFYRFVEREVIVAEYDCIVCSTFNLFPLLTAQKLAQQYNKPFVVDLRDIDEQWGKVAFFTHSLPSLFGLDKLIGQLYRKRNIRLRNQVLRTAQAITTISPWHVDFLQQIHPNVNLIYNGFNADEFYPQDIHTDKFIIAHTGRIFNFELRNPTLLFAGLQQLKHNQQINLKDVEIHFYMDDESNQLVQTLSKDYTVDHFVHCHSFVPHTKLLPLLHQSSILLILANKVTQDGPFGIMTTKFFEALGVEKPVLCVRSDEDCLAAAIQQTNAGLAAQTTEEVADFILEKYNEWKAQSFTHQVVQNKELFTRQYQAEQFAHLFESIIV